MTTFKITNLPNILIIGRRICNSDWQYKSYTIKNYELMFVYQGKAKVILDEKSYSLCVGNCLLLKPNQVFSSSTTKNNPCQYYIVHFSIDTKIDHISKSAAYRRVSSVIERQSYDDIDDVFSMPHVNLKEVFINEKISLGHKSNVIFAILEKAITEKNQLNISNDLLTSCYLCEIFVQLTRITLQALGLNPLAVKNENIPRLLLNALYFIHENYTKQINVNYICKQLNVSSQYLIRIFKTSLGITPLQYINTFRINRAKDLLTHTSLSIKEISYAVGIDNNHYFCRLFKNKLGITPSQFRAL